MNASRCAATWQGESRGAHTLGACVLVSLGPARPCPFVCLWGGSASAVFSAARFRFPFESLSYTIYKYGIGALLPRPTRVDLTCYLAHAALRARSIWPAGHATWTHACRRDVAHVMLVAMCSHRSCIGHLALETRASGCPPWAHRRPACSYQKCPPRPSTSQCRGVLADRRRTTAPLSPFRVWVVGV